MLKIKKLMRAIWRFLLEYIPFVAPITGTIALVTGVVASFSSADRDKLYWPLNQHSARIFYWTAAIGLLFNIVLTLRERSVRQLTIENSRLEGIEDLIQQKYKDLLKLELRDLSQRLGFGNKDRISLYRHVGSAFFLLSRYSHHGLYDAANRPYYPEGQGCIGVAWAAGQSHREFPDPSHREYRKQLKDLAIDATTAAKMRMKSRSYSAYRLTRLTGAKHFCVIVFESTEPESASVERVGKLFGEAERQKLTEWLETMERFEPEPQFAKQEGY